MQGSKSSINCIADDFLGPSNTCTGKIARILFIIATCSFTSALSSTIASSYIYLFDSGLRAECSAMALSLLSIAASVVGVVGFVSAIGIGKGGYVGTMMFTALLLFLLNMMLTQAPHLYILVLALLLHSKLILILAITQYRVVITSKHLFKAS